MARRVSVHAVTRQPLALALRDDVIRALHRENEALRRMLETRKLVERSQGLRMLRDGLSEPEAFRHIPKTSINTRTPMAEVARGVLRAVEMVHAADRLRPALAAVLPVLRNSGPERLPGAPPRPRTARGPMELPPPTGQPMSRSRSSPRARDEDRVIGVRVGSTPSSPGRVRESVARRGNRAAVAGNKAGGPLPALDGFPGSR
jgi:ANTAR domain